MSIKRFDQKYSSKNTNPAESYNYELTELRFSGVFLGGINSKPDDKNGIMEIGIKTYKEYPSGKSRSSFETTHMTREETEALRDHLNVLLDDRERW